MTVIKSSFRRKSALVKALQKVDNGKWANAVEVSDEKCTMYGYDGATRPTKAEIIIRRKNVGGGSNDIGFTLEKDGTYSAIISDYDSGRYNENWLNKLLGKYSSATIEEVAMEQGFSFSEEEVNGEIFVTCERSY
jgi:hypothetical protein